MKRILAVIVFFAAATSLALGQRADKQEKTKSEKAGVGHILPQMPDDQRFMGSERQFGWRLETQPLPSKLTDVMKVESVNSNKYIL